MRPLFYQYPRDKECYASEWENSEYFVGPDILVAPILDAGKSQRKVYLPQGIAYLSKLLDHIKESGLTSSLIKNTMEIKY